MNELISLLDEIATDVVFHCSIVDNDEEVMREKADNFFKRFQTIYDRIDRHRYSEVSKYIDSLLQDVVDALRDGMKHIIICAEANYYNKDPGTSKNYECYKRVYKLYDHIELEAARYSSIKKIQLMADAQYEKEKETGKLLEDANAAVSEAHEQAKSLSQQLISILGIFAGIIVTFSFATTIIGETVANLAKSDIVYLGFIICVLGTVFINIIAFLLSFVTKLSGHTLSEKFPLVMFIVGNIATVSLSLFFFFNLN